MASLIPRRTLSVGAIVRWHVVGGALPWLEFPGRQPVHLLDVGCGRGEYVVRLARMIPSADRVVGVDKAGRDDVVGFAPVPPDVSARVSLRDEEFSPRVVADAAPYDGVLCLDVLEHIEDDKKFLSDLSAVVRPGGRGLVHVPATPQRHPVRPVAQVLERMLLERTGQHVREGYSLEQISALLDDTGWAVLHVRATFGRLAAWWCDADFWLAERRLHTVRLLGLPLTVAIAVAARAVRPQMGNGWLLFIERRKD